MSFPEKVINELSRCTDILPLNYKINTASNKDSNPKINHHSVDFELFFDGRNNLCDLVSRQTNHQPQYDNDPKCTLCLLNTLFYFFMTFLLHSFSL